MTSKIEISHKTIIFTVLFLASIWLVLRIKDILFLLFISFIFMSALRPLVDRMERIKIPRTLAIIMIYFGVLGFLAVSFAGIVPSLVVQTSRLAQDLPVVITRILPYWNIDARALTAQIAPISENIVKVTFGIFSNLITTVTVLVITFYFLLERKHTELFLENTMGVEAADKVIHVVKNIERRLGSWVHGELLLMMLIGIFSYLGLTFLHVDFALPLAIIAGILEAVPMIGPILSAIPAILVALATSPFLALSVVALYFIVQQVENHLVVPLVMRKSVGLSPLLTIVALLIGARIGGAAGAIVAVPALLVSQEVLKLFLTISSKKD